MTVSVHVVIVTLPAVSVAVTVAVVVPFGKGEPGGGLNTKATPLHASLAVWR